MRILIACETSGVVREAFRARGHDAWSCDLLPADDGSRFHYHCPVEEPLYFDWDMLIAHPPCTFLAASGLHWNKRRPERQQQTDDALAFVRYLMAADVPRICIENPVGRIGTAIRPADQYIQPYQFGHDASKRTGLWLDGLWPLRPTRMVEPRLICCGMVLPRNDKYGCPNCHGNNQRKVRPRWANQTDSGQNRLPPSADRWKQRARTYEGIAKAMAEQWG